MSSTTNKLKQAFNSSMPNIGQVTMLSKLNLARRDQTIKVKVIRLWKHTMFNNPNKLLSIEMILLDEEGTTIHANVIKCRVSQFEDTFKELDCYFIVKPTIRKSDQGRYKYVANENKLGFMIDTKVYPCQDWSGPEYGFCFTPFKPIIDSKLAEYTPIDIIGFINDVKPLQNFNKGVNKKESRKVNVILTDLQMQSITISLWNDYADRVIDHWNNKEEDSVNVLILQFGSIRNWSNYSYVNSAFEILKLYLDEDVEEMHSFRKSLLNFSAATSSSSQTTKVSGRFLSMYDEYVVKTEFNHIAEVNISKVKSVVIVGVSRFVPVDSPWYYVSCNHCNKKLLKEEDATEIEQKSEAVNGFVCITSECVQKEIKPIKRYKMNLVVQDSTGSICLTLFDREATKILKISAADLIEKYFNSPIKQLMPEEFVVYEEKKFAFKIDITDYNVKNRNWVFGISKITDDEQIISELEGKANNSQAYELNSMLNPADENQSQETVDLKDTVESIDDCITPYSENEKTVGKRPIKEKSTFKRKSKKPDFGCNLIDSLNEEDVAVLSTTKPQPAGKPPLLIPKIEK